MRGTLTETWRRTCDVVRSVALASSLAGTLLAPTLAPAGPDSVEPEDISESAAAPVGGVYARVRHLTGRVTLLQESDGERDEVTINTPVAPGGTVETDPRSRVEVQLADGSFVRLEEASRASFLSLADSGNRYEDRTLISLEAGSLSMQVENSDPDRRVVRVDTEAASIFFLSDGLFRIDVGAGGATKVISRRGVAEVVAADEESTLVRSGEQTFVTPGRSAEAPRLARTRAGDEFDRYVEERRQAYLDREEGEGQREYADAVPSEVRPYARELGYYGQWDYVPSYGTVWIPNVAVGWHPYYYGYWTYRPIGWCWVSYDPWGYAPYHYGRWEFLGGRGWCWLPGAVYAPAWVSWGYWGGSIGWCPLGWYDYPSGWGFSIRFGSFFSPYWTFVSYNHFTFRQIDRVAIRERAIEREVAFSQRQPGVRPVDFRQGRQVRVFEQARRSSVADDTRIRRFAAERPATARGFRPREEHILRSAARPGAASEARARQARGGDRVTGRSAPRGAALDGRRPLSSGRERALDRIAQPPHRVGGSRDETVSDATRREGSARAVEDRPRTADRRSLLPGVSADKAREPGRRPVSSAARPESGGDRGRPGETRRVPDAETRRLLEDTRTRRGPEEPVDGRGPERQPIRDRAVREPGRPVSPDSGPPGVGSATGRRSSEPAEPFRQAPRVMRPQSPAPRPVPSMERPQRSSPAPPPSAGRPSGGESPRSAERGGHGRSQDNKGRSAERNDRRGGKDR